MNNLLPFVMSAYISVMTTVWPTVAIQQAIDHLTIKTEIRAIV